MNEENETTLSEVSPLPESWDDFDEVVSAMGITFARKGRFTRIIGPDEDTRRQILHNLVSSVEQLESNIEDEISALEELISKQNPFDLIASIVCANSFIDPETYKEYKHEGVSAIAEYLACLYLCKAEDSYAFDDRKSTVSSEVIQEQVKTILSETTLLFEAKRLDPTGEMLPGILEDIEVRTFLNSLYTRKPYYHQHLLELLDELFKPLEGQLRATLGFSMSDALAISDSVARLVQENVNNRENQLVETRMDLYKAVMEYRQTGQASSKYSMEFLQRFSEKCSSEPQKVIDNFLGLWFFFAFGDNFLFSPEQICKVSKIPSVVVETFLQHMSLEFGDIDPAYYRFPSATHPVRLKPFIRFQEQFFIIDPNLLYESLLWGVEALINPEHGNAVVQNNSMWHVYDRAKANYLEEKACLYLGSILKHAQVYRNLYYFAEEEGETKRCELDGLVIYDSVLFLIEAKAGTLSESARRGAPKRIEHDLKKLVQDAYEQAVRARRYIESQARVEFTLENGNIVGIEKDKFHEVFLINVTLDHLESFVANAYELKDLGFFSGKDVPWSVSLGDLRVISEVVEFPSQFVHYLLWRRRLNELQNNYANDELDWFMYYLKEGSKFDDVAKHLEHHNIVMQLNSYTTDLDDYYLYIMGDRKTVATKPAQDMPDVFHEMINGLEKAHSDGYLRIACALLDLPNKHREQFAKAASQQHHKTLGDKKRHDFTLVFNERGYGVTFMFAPTSEQDVLLRKLDSYCLVKKYQMRFERWYALGCLVEQPGWIHMAKIFEYPWKHDVEMDAIVNKMSRSKEIPIQ